MKSRILPLLLVFMIWAPSAFSEVYTPEQVNKYATDRLEAAVKSQADDIEMIFNSKAVEDTEVGNFAHKLYLSTSSFDDKAIELFRRRVEAAGWDVYFDKSLKDVTVLTIVKKNTLP